MTTDKADTSPALAIGPESRAERATNDAVAIAAIDYLGQQHFLPAGPPSTSADGPHIMESFRQAEADIGGSFDVPESSLTTLMARIYYGTAARLMPARLLAIGVGNGNGLAYLYHPVRDRAYALAVDIDPVAADLARRNLAAAGMNHVNVICLDGHRAREAMPGPYDLVLLDADDPLLRKRIYCSLLQTLEPSLRPGAVILAHDADYPAFAEDLRPYKALVRDPARFRASVTLAIDPFGVEVTVR